MTCKNDIAGRARHVTVIWDLFAADGQLAADKGTGPILWPV